MGPSPGVPLAFAGDAPGDRRSPHGSDPAPRADRSGQDPAGGLARLFVRDVTGERVEQIDRAPYTIGRRESSALRLSGTEVSREHAEIIRDGARYVLRDCGSSYGTFVNDRLVAEHVLVPGDRIRLGRSGGADLVFEPKDTSGGTSQSGSDPFADFRLLPTVLDGLRALGPGHVLREVLARVLDSAIALSDAERGSVLLASPEGTLGFALGRTRGQTTPDDACFEVSRKIPDAALRTGEVQIVRDLQEADLAQNHLETVKLGIRHVLCVPLHAVRFADVAEPHVASRCIGVLYLDSREAGTLLSKSVRSWLTTLATEAAVAIENARLYREADEKARMDREMRIAVEIQRMLLPKVSVTLPFVQAAAASLPCRSVGGDFYDCFVQEHDCFAFTLGDVAGKGPSAALLSALLQGMLSIAAPGCASPAAVVSRLNKALCGRGIASRFATLFFGAIEPGGRFAFCNGGHNPPFLFGRSGVQRLDEGGPIVGAFDFATYREGVVALEPGDRLVLFSDGVSEALSGGGDEFGDARILDIIEAVHAGSTDLDPASLVEALITAVRQFANGAAQSDDITVMVVQYRGTRLPAGC